MKEAGSLIQMNLAGSTSLINNYQDSLILLGVPPEDARNNASHLGCVINQGINKKNKEWIIKDVQQLVGSIKKGVAVAERTDPSIKEVSSRDREIRRYLGRLSDYGAKTLFIGSTAAEQLNGIVGLADIILVSDLIQPYDSRRGITFYGAAELSKMTGSPTSLALAMNAAIGVIIDINLDEKRVRESASIQKKLIQATNLLAEPVFEIGERMKTAGLDKVIYEVRGRTAKFFSQGSGK